MKKLCSLFGFASLLLLSFAFTPAETVLEETTEVCTEITSDVSAENAMMFGSGKFYGCPISAAPGANVTYSLFHAGGSAPVFGDADCMPDFITLAPGNWFLFADTDTDAYVYFEWDNCGMNQSANAIVPGGPGSPPVFVTQIFVPCP